MKVFRFLSVAVSLCVMGLTGQAAWAGFAGPVMTEGGLIQGTVDGDITVFKGVPFAAPPVGELRWMAPARESSWSGVKGATSYAPACVQVSRALPFLGIEKVDTSEDCLYLNIWTPAKSADDKLPVMVWLHGGGFTIGSPTLQAYAGDKLAKRGVIVVTVAYRLGALGFLAHPDLSRGIRPSRLRQLRPAGHDRRPALGARQHRGLRRRPGPGDDLRGIGGRRGGQPYWRPHPWPRVCSSGRSAKAAAPSSRPARRRFRAKACCGSPMPKRRA